MKALLAAFVISALIVTALAEMHVVEVAEANFFPPADNKIEMTFYTTYLSSSLEVSFKAKCSGSVGSEQVEFWMVLDGKRFVQIVNYTTQYGMLKYRGSEFPNDIVQGKTVLTNISNGAHNLTLKMVDKYSQDPFLAFVFCSNTLSFVIATPAPVVSHISIENRTYDTNTLTLSFSVSEPSTTWFSLNGKDDAAIDGNSTLRGLRDGSYSIVVYANDTDGNMGKSEPVSFTIDTKPSPSPSPSFSPTLSPSQPPEPQPSAFPLEFFYVAIGGAAVVIVTVAAVANRKRKQ